MSGTTISLSNPWFAPTTSGYVRAIGWRAGPSASLLAQFEQLYPTPGPILQRRRSCCVPQPLDQPESLGACSCMTPSVVALLTGP